MSTHVQRVLSSCLWLLCTGLFSATPVVARGSDFLLAPLFTSNMVLQRDATVPVWGRGAPGSEVRIISSWGARATAVTDSAGTWAARLRTSRAGGPYGLRIECGDTIALLQNVLLGEVWLCSGQSNMEMPLEGWVPGDTVLNSGEAIASSAIPGLRLFTVKRQFSAVPQESCNGTWVASSPATSRTFSATAFFFARKLQQALKVPIGLINASWGGTPVEAWTSAEYLSEIPQIKPVLRRIAGGQDSIARLVQWLQGFPALDMRARSGEGKWKNLSFGDDSCASPGYNDSTWHLMKLPTVWERTEVGDFDGVVWFRKRITIPAAWVNRDLVLELGPVDDMDETYVNGNPVGSHLGEGLWKVERVYRVPAPLVHDSVLTIAVRVIDYQGGGGIFGDASSLSIHPEADRAGIPLAGAWKYLPVAEYRAETFFAFGAKGEQFFARPRLPLNLGASAPTTLFNGMIAPLVPFTVRGVIWYQGETNTDNPVAYRTLFPLMIRNWRDAFKNASLPFYYVQIAPFMYDSTTASQYLREAQLMALSEPNTGMVVTLDIGNSGNIHPANKPEVGRRLALWALARTYGKKNAAYAGPVYRSMKVRHGKAILSFDHAGKGLVMIGGRFGNGFQIAGSDRIFRNAEVEVQGSRLLVFHPEVPDPAAVRYAFTNAPEATLFNTDGLPASSFRTDPWDIAGRSVTLRDRP